MIESYHPTQNPIFKRYLDSTIHSKQKKIQQPHPPKINLKLLIGICPIDPSKCSFCLVGSSGAEVFREALLSALLISRARCQGQREDCRLIGPPEVEGHLEPAQKAPTVPYLVGLAGRWHVFRGHFYCVGWARDV